MRLAIGSDFHGAAHFCEKFFQKAAELQVDKIILLGDLLYHGPRNDLPEDYAPKTCIELFNAHATQIIAVRGNCEAEVDQMVLKFACMADSASLYDEKTRKTLFFTHGHIFGAGMHNSVLHLPSLEPGSTIIYGHTHIKVNEDMPDKPYHLFNPGSVGIPKDGSHSMGLYDEGSFSHIILD